jgi:hypothetical protein
MMMICIYLFKFRFGYSADAVSSEVGVPGLDAPEATKVFVSLLLPLGDEVRVRYPLLAAVVVQLYTHTIIIIIIYNLLHCRLTAPYSPLLMAFRR